MKKSILIIALAVAAMACNSNGTRDFGGKTAEETAADTIVDFIGKEWKLRELNGSPIVLDTTFPKQPHIIFDDAERLHGNLGCNGFGANVEFKGEDGMTVSRIAATQMACGNLEIEQQFSAALENATSYQVAGNILTLANNKKEVVAKLEKVPNP